MSQKKFIIDGGFHTTEDSSITGNLDMTGHIIPTVDSDGFTGYDLGSPDMKWRDLYLSQGSLYIDGQKVIESNSGTIVVQADPDQSLTTKVSGSGVMTLESDTTINIASTLQMQAGKKITDQGGNAVAFGDKVDMDNNQIINVGVPTANEHAATKAYVDTAISEISTDAITEGDTEIEIADLGTGTVGITVDGTQRFALSQSALELTVPVTVNGATLANEAYVDSAAADAAADATSKADAAVATAATDATTKANAAESAAVATAAAYTDTKVADLVDTAPATLDTLNELAAALGDDPNFATTTANNIATKLSLSGGAMTGPITTTSTIDGRDIATDGAKLDGIESGADVTDTVNVTAAGALMGSEVINLDQVKAFNSSDYATAAQGTLADSATQPGDLATVATTGSYSDLSDKPISYSDSSVDAHLNTGTALTDQVLSYDGSNYAWVSPDSSAAITFAPSASAPTVGSAGSVYYNTTDDLPYVSDGTQWKAFRNLAPAPTDGTRSLSGDANVALTSHNLDTDFTDDKDVAALTYSLSSGSLPSGVSISGNLLSGTPTSYGTFTFTIVATDAQGDFSDPKSYSLVINAAPFAATGGTEYTSGGYKYHKFTSSSTFSVSGDIPKSCEILLVAGGGGGGFDHGGGGGAGGCFTSTQSVSAGSHSIVIGGGGGQNSNGSSSTALGLTAIGGGRGAGRGQYNSSGGSGGGGGGYQALSTGGASGTSGQGNSGGSTGPAYQGGGGGGKSASGAAGNSSAGGAGGAGSTNLSTWATATSSGSGGRYAGGGGGGGWRDAGKYGGAGGAGGGGGGGSSTGSRGYGTVNTGGGGGGGGQGGTSGGSGGSGIVIIRYPI